MPLSHQDRHSVVGLWSTAPRASTAVVAGLVLALVSVAAEAQPWRKNRAYPDGQVVIVAGTVTDGAGRGLPQVDVVFTASRRHFSFKQFKSVDSQPRELRTKTDDRGNYRLEWQWHHYFTSFELKAIAPVRLAGGEEREHVLARLDLSERIRGGTPVSASLEVSDTRFLDDLRAFLAELDTDDERRVYEQEGKPDRVETVSRLEDEEESWWYFSLGALYRFRNGQLIEVENFEPIRDFGG